MNKHPIEILNNTQKDLLQALISEKLKQTNHEDEVLLEYTMVLLSNKKTESVMKEDLKPFLGASTDSLVDWIWLMMNEITAGNLESVHRGDRNRDSDRDRERENREPLREKDRDRVRVTTQDSYRENSDLKKNTRSASGNRFSQSAVKSNQDPKKNINNKGKSIDTDYRKKDSFSRKTKNNHEDYRRRNGSIPSAVDRGDLKRIRTDNEPITVANKKAKVFISPEAKNKLVVPQGEESEGVTFTVTIGDDKASTPLIENTLIHTESHEPIIHKPKIFPTPRYPHYSKPKQIYNRAPRTTYGRFKNMSLVLDKNNNNNNNNNDPKNPSSGSSDNNNNKKEEMDTQKDEKQVTPHIPPKKLPQNFPKQKCAASSAPVNFLASKLSLDTELPDITVTRGGNMVWRSHEIKVEK